MCDRFGATRFIVLGTVLHLLALWTGFIDRRLAVPVLLVFVTFMLSGSVRMVPNASLATRVPPPARRAGFMSTQSAVQHTGSALGAVASATILTAEPGGHLLHMPYVAGLAALMALVVPFLSWQVERGLVRRGA